MMKFIVKAFELDGQEMNFENTVIGEEKEISFENVKAAEAFIQGNIRNLRVLVSWFLI
jgi:hypothetical protein